MADTFPLAAVGNPAAEFANKSKSVANKVLAVACNQWSAVRYTLTLWTDFRPCIPTTITWYICALLAAVKTNLLVALQAKGAAVPNPIDALSANAKSVTQDAKASVNGAGVPDPVRFAAPCLQIRCTYQIRCTHQS